MPNRFTDDLLTVPDNSIVFAVCKILQPPRDIFFPYWWQLDCSTVTGDTYIKISETMICLLAAMSDADIDELIINWKE